VFVRYLIKNGSPGLLRDRWRIHGAVALQALPHYCSNILPSRSDHIHGDVSLWALLMVSKRKPVMANRTLACWHEDPSLVGWSSLFPADDSSSKGHTSTANNHL